MASSEVVTTVISLAKDVLTYMLPVIGVMAGLVFIFSWIHSITIGAARHSFKD